MEVQIVEKRADKVCVNTAIGCFYGVWCSSEPAIFSRYIVELDSDEVLAFDAIKRSKTHKPSIESTDEAIYITGLVEEIQDRVMILRLQKTIMMLEITTNLALEQHIGHYVRVRLNEIRLYDTGIRGRFSTGDGLREP